MVAARFFGTYNEGFCRLSDLGDRKRRRGVFVHPDEMARVTRPRPTVPTSPPTSRDSCGSGPKCARTTNTHGITTLKTPKSRHRSKDRLNK